MQQASDANITRFENTLHSGGQVVPTGTTSNRRGRVHWPRPVVETTNAAGRRQKSATTSRPLRARCGADTRMDARKRSGR